MMELAKINQLLREWLPGRPVSEIHHGGSFLITFMATHHRYDSNFPYAITVALHADWYIKEVGPWPDVVNQFPDLRLPLGQPEQPLQAFYIHSITQNSKIEDIEVVPDLSLHIKFDNGYTIVAPSIDEYAEYPWIIFAEDDTKFPNFYFRLDSDDRTIYSKMDF